jgi:hypothetical protein
VQIFSVFNKEKEGRFAGVGKEVEGTGKSSQDAPSKSLISLAKSNQLMRP